MGHHHNHNQSGENLRIAFFLNFGFTIFEIIGGLYVNSIAIISDAIHDFGDSVSLGTAWYLDHKSKQGSDHQFSFGYARFSLLGALINSIILIVGSVYILIRAIERFVNPEPTNANGMILFAIFGVLVNGYAAWKMSGGKTLNEKVMSWHLVEDVLGWVAILMVGIVLKFKEINFLDPALSLAITAYILWGVLGRLKEVLLVFLQGVPKEMDIVEIEQQILSVENVESVRHTRIWSLEGESHVFSTHVKLEDNVKSLQQIIETRSEIKKLLYKYHFADCTIETEFSSEEDILKKLK